MAQKIQTYSVYYDNNERAQKLPTEDYDVYLSMIQHMTNKGESIIFIDILMERALDDFEKAHAAGKSARSVTGKSFPEYIAKLKAKINLKDAFEQRKKADYEKYLFSGIWFTICSFLVLLFLKEVLTDHYLINYYVDLIVGAVSLYLAASNIYQHQKIIKRWKFSKKSLIMDIVGIVLSIVVIFITLQSPYDITFLILVAAHVTGRIIIKDEFTKASIA